MVAAILDKSTGLLQSAAKQVWNRLPERATRRIEAWMEHQGWKTKGAIKTSGTVALAAAPLLIAGTGPVGLAVGAAFALIGGRATHLTQEFIGPSLPKNPENELLRTAHTIALFHGKNNGRTPPPPVAAAAPPKVSPLRAAQLLETDRNLETLIQGASIACTIALVHGRCLGLPIDAEMIPRIIHAAKAPNAKLWDVYMSHLGKNLTFWQWIRAGFWFFLSYSLQIIPNSVRTFLTNILKEGRDNFSDPSKINNLDYGFTILLDQTSSFLKAYNSATMQYAQATNLEGDLDAYRKAAIEKLTPIPLATLIKEFSNTLIDKFFPRIPFFESLKTFPLLGWVFSILDYLIGGVINCIGRRILKAELPGALDNFLTKGLKATHPTNLSFVIAMTESLTKLFTDLEKEPSSIGEIPPFIPEKLPSVLNDFLILLELHGPKDKPFFTPEELRKEWHNIHHGNQTKRKNLHKAMLEVAHTFIIYLTQNTEEIFSNVLELLNAPFTETKPKTKLDYEKALKGLDEAASRTFQKLIHESLAGVPIEQQRAYFHPLIEQHQAVIEQAMRQIVAINQNITHDHPPEQILDAITAYIRALEPLIQDDAAHRAKLAGASIEHAFYLTFHPFHHQLPKISEQLLTLQSTLHALQRAHSVGKSLSDMGQTLGRFSQTSQPPRETLVPTHLRPLLRQVQERASPTLSMSSHAIEPNLSHLVYLF